MIDLKDYDNAVIKFRKSLDFTMLPVLSWDFYASNYEEIKQTEEDAVTLLSLVTANSWNIDIDILDTKLKADKNVIVVTDAKLNIVFATKNMWNMSQYHPEEIIGKSPKMFQGNLTSNSTLKVVSDAVKEKKPFEVTVVNYRKDGSTYKCWIQGQPIFDNKGDVVNFIAFEKEVA
ncbi:PAS domain-containing protein [uncultured Maribacter sp.]|uniref:PAS domain-containing protein n=1 Tax=uncultured Maribacter sp. TaxID=431308 RepID=UPI00263434F6|nr:PAS domain-containing protein [uncultured Maribacter sp.]